jgi:hypothetical protein
MVELVDALVDVLCQAAGRSDDDYIVCHDFISAYENALSLLEHLGYATTEDGIYYKLIRPTQV